MSVFLLGHLSNNQVEIRNFLSIISTRKSIKLLSVFLFVAVFLLKKIEFCGQSKGIDKCINEYFLALNY